MKHYLMILIFLFSSLSAQWAGAVSLNKSATESIASMSTVSTSPYSAMHHVSHNPQNADEMHDCCPSMQKITLETIAHCGDNCQCENGQVCQNYSPLMNLDQQLFQTGPLSAYSIISYSQVLPSVALAPEFKPPQS